MNLTDNHIRKIDDEVAKGEVIRSKCDLGNEILAILDAANLEDVIDKGEEDEGKADRVSVVVEERASRNIRITQ